MNASHGGAQEAIDPAAARVAADWFSRWSCGTFGDSERNAWMTWRASHPAHEHAWQQVEAVSQRFGLLLPEAGMAALDRNNAGIRRRQVLRALGLGGVFVGAGWQVWQRTPLQDLSADYRSATGERREVTLADGTQLMLNTSSAVDVHVSSQERRITLRHGEIQVVTAPDRYRRPLIVATRFGQLLPIGTRFLVRQDEDSVSLTVLEGAVQMRPVARAPVSAPSSLVRAGQSAVLDRRGASPPAPACDSADAWSQGMLVADGMRLSVFAAELSRYRRGVLTCDPAVADLRLSGAFSLDDTDSALASATRALPVRIESITRFWIRLRPA